MRTVRIRVMDEYQMELLSLNKFINPEGKIEPRGIITFLAEGKHGQFNFNPHKSTLGTDIATLNLKPGMDRFLAVKPDGYIGYSQFNELKFASPPENLGK